MFERAKVRAAVFAFAAVYVALMVAAAVMLAPIQDETYYWAWARAPALAYVDHPPAIAWIVALATAVFGDGIAALRVPALLAAALTAVLAVAASRRLAPHLQAQSASWLALLLLAGAPMFAVGYLPATPDPFQGASIALAAYLVIRALEEDSRAIWGFLAAFVLAASVLIKHSSGVIAIGALFGAFASARGRAVLSRPATWAGALLGLAVLAPWFYADSGASIAFQAARVASRGEPRGLLAIPVLAGGVALALGPGGALAFAAALSRAREHPASLALACGATLLIISCAIPVWFGGGELNWSMPAFVFVLPAAAAAVASRSGHLARSVRAAGLTSAALLALALAHVAHPFLPISAAKDTTLRGAGYDTLAARAREEAARHGATVIVTRRYTAASELRFHLGDALPVLELGTTRRSQYDLWAKPPLCAGDIALVVSNTASLPPELAAAAGDGEDTITVDRTARGELIERWYLTPVRAAADHDRGSRCSERITARREGAPP